MSDSRVVFFDALIPRVWVLDSSGNVRLMVRKGSGPGDCRMPAFVGEFGDTTGLLRQRDVPMVHGSRAIRACQQQPAQLQAILVSADQRPDVFTARAVPRWFTCSSTKDFRAEGREISQRSWKENCNSWQTLARMTPSSTSHPTVAARVHIAAENS